MSAPTNCPACGSDDINFSAKRADWVCADCAQRFAADTQPARDASAGPPLSVAAFISYGHADGTDFADRLKAELEARGVTPVWLDSEMIAAGDDFWAAMQAGIAGSDALLAVMTPSSLREGSVCWREIAFADDRGKRIVPVRIDADPALRANVLLVGRSWADFTSSEWGDAVERLLRGLSGEDAALRSVGVIGGIAPLRFAEDVSRHLQQFSGREWLDAELDAWLRSDAGRAFIIVGEPGIGKSAIAAHLTTRGDVVAWHFCTARGYERSLNPQEFVASVVSALSQRLPAFADALASRHPELPREDAGSAFRELVVEPARAIEPPSSPQLLIIDALDEAATRTREGGTIVDLIAAHAALLPAWLRIVATSRPETVVTSKLKALHPFELAAHRPENLADVAAYVASRTSSMDSIPASERARVTAVLTGKAAGNFLWAKRALDALTERSITLGDVPDLPEGLNAFYSLEFSRAFPDAEDFLRDFAPILRPLAAALAPVPFDILQAAANLDASVLNLRLSRLRSYLSVGADSTYSLFHRSLSEWVVDRDSSSAYWCDVEAGHEQMISALADAPLASDYAVRWLPRHLSALERWEALVALLTDLPFLDAAWDLDQHEVLRLWAKVEGASVLRMTDAYRDVVSSPTGAAEEFVLALLLQHTGHLEGASALYACRIDLHRASGKDLAGLGISLGNQAIILKAWGKLDEAMALHKEEESICRDLGDLAGLQASLGNQALILKAWGKLDEAMALMKEQERICRELGDVARLANTLYYETLCLRDLERSEEALVVSAEEETLRRQLGQTADLADCLSVRAGILRKRGELEAALAPYSEAERLYREIGSTDNLARILHWHAVCLVDCERSDEAIACWRESAALRLEQGKADAARECRWAIVDTLRFASRTDEALAEVETLLAALDIDDDSHQQLLGLRALVLADAGRPDEALVDLDEKTRLCEEAGNQRGLAWTHARRAYVAARAAAPDAEVIGFVRAAYAHALANDSAKMAAHIVSETIADFEKAGLSAYLEPLRALRDELAAAEPPGA